MLRGKAPTFAAVFFSLKNLSCSSAYFEFTHFANATAKNPVARLVGNRAVKCREIYLIVQLLGMAQHKQMVW